MIAFANRFERRLELLVIGEPSTDLGHALAPQAELARAPAWIAHGEDRKRVALAAGALGAARGMVADVRISSEPRKMSAVSGRRSSRRARAAMVRSRLILIDETDSLPQVNTFGGKFPEFFDRLSIAAGSRGGRRQNRPLLHLP